MLRETQTQKYQTNLTSDSNLDIDNMSNSTQDTKIEITYENLKRMVDYIVSQNKTSSEAMEGKEEESMPTLKEGTIRRRKDGRYEARYMDQGKQKSVYSHTQKDCINKLRNAIKDRGKNSTPKSIKYNITLDEWFNKWLLNYKSHITEKSRHEIKRRYENHIKGTFGKRTLRGITAIELQEHLKDIKQFSVQERLIRELSSVFQKAKVTKHISENVMEAVDIIIVHEEKSVTAPDEHQFNRFVDYLDFARNELRYLVELTGYTGMRTGEVCALELQDIDFVNKTISINKAIIKDTNKVGETKTPSSNRVIPLFARAEKCIREYISIYGPTSRLFYQMKAKNVINSVRYHAKKFDLKGVSMHTFRVYFSTICRNYGIDPKVVQKWLGHKNLDVTMNTYTQVQPSLWLKEAEKFNRESIKPTLN